MSCCLYNYLCRYLLTLKRYVRNRCRPEGSIAEGYLADDCLTFCSRYLDGIETRLTRKDRNSEGDFIGAPTINNQDTLLVEIAHRYVLFNFDNIEKYRMLHKMSIKHKAPRISPWVLENRHHKEFVHWFREHVSMQLLI